jgi:AcrR family transcriptional regulator
MTFATASDGYRDGVAGSRRSEVKAGFGTPAPPGASAAASNRVSGPAARPYGRGDETRQALLDAAHDLLASEGPGSLTVRRIAAAAGMSTMNVYSRFGGKDGVLDELFTDGFRRLGAEMDAAPESGDPEGDLQRCGQLYRRFAREHPTYYSLMFDRVVPDFEPSDGARAVALGTLAKLQQRVERVMAAGVIRPADSFTVATVLWACMHGVVSLEARSAGDVDFDWDTVFRLAMDALRRGLA